MIKKVDTLANRLSYALREDKKSRTVKNYEGIVKKERCGLDCVRR